MHFAQADFQNAIMWLRDTGILNKLKYDVMNPPIPIPDPVVRHKKPLILRQLGITMIMIAAGLFIALMVFFGELCKERRTGSVQEHKQE